LFCLFFKSFKCCQNDSFYYLCDSVVRDHQRINNITTVTVPLTNEEENLNELDDKGMSIVVNHESDNNETVYGILNNYSLIQTPLLNVTKADTSSKLKDSSNFYSTFTFKSFKTLDQEEEEEESKNKLKECNNNNDYLDICHTLESVTDSLNKELELIDSTLAKRTIKAESIKDEKEEEDVGEEDDKLLNDLLPMADLSSITDINNTKYK